MMSENKDTTKEFFIDSEDKERLENYQYPTIPEAQFCPYCNKKLGWKGLINPFDQNRIFSWFSIIDCDCEEYLKNKELKKMQEIEENKKREEAERKLAYQRKIEKLFEQSNISKRGMNRTFETFEINDENEKVYTMAKRYADCWEKYKEDGTGLIFIGKYGTGKTHLAFSIANSLLIQGVPVIYETFINLMEKLKESYSNNNLDYYEIIKLYCQCDLLIIDDLGKERLSEWVLEKLFQIINTRYENMLPIIITTNYTEQELVKRLSLGNDGRTAASLVSRLNEICIEIDTDFQDYRKK